MVFVLPIIFTVIVGSIVMADILEKPDRQLNMWPFSFSEITFVYDFPIKLLNSATSTPLIIDMVSKASLNTSTSEIFTIK